ncbi:MAG TPA: Ig-like domain-containing protein [Longimicrobiales bacterium]
MRSWRILIPLLVVAALSRCDGGSTDPDLTTRVMLTPQVDTLNALGAAVLLTAQVTDGAGNVVSDAVVEWSSLDPVVATVDSAGRVVARAPGGTGIVAAVGDAADTAQIFVEAEVEESELQFLSFSSSSGSTPMGSATTSFWAVRGENRSAEILYGPEAGEAAGEELLTFEVPGNSLLEYPDGTPFDRGDSVQITIHLDAEGRFVFRFEPSGLRFDPEHPAELEIDYRGADLDLDGDGDVDAEDDEAERELYLWKQEREGDPWLRLGTVKLEDLDELEAKIDGFTGFAVAR